jgi:hypothetical protein
MATEKSENEAHFRRLEAMLLHSSSSRSVPKMAQRRTHPEKGNAIFVLHFCFSSVNMTIVQVDHFNDYA